MLNRKQIREAIACSQLGDKTYGKWGILTVEQRLTIARLLDDLDHADNYIKKLYFENQKQKEVIDNIKKCFDDGHFEDGCDCLIIEKYIDSYLKEVS